MPLKEKHKKLLESSSSNCEFIHLGQIKPSLEQVKDANVIIGNIPVDILKNIRQFRICTTQQCRYKWIFR